MRKKLTCIDISKLLELKKILLEEKFLNLLKENKIKDLKIILVKMLTNYTYY